jgi:hypothetical protein
VNFGTRPQSDIQNTRVQWPVLWVTSPRNLLSDSSDRFTRV